MLQQTQVATVVSYYEKWMKLWPTLGHLSNASLDEVNKAWAGLGYYSRGRRLREGAQKIVEKLDGRMPRTSEALMKELPGVGRYTACAIASIAFSQPVGVVDGNVIRVLGRILAIGADSDAKPTIEAFWKNAHRLVDPKVPGDFNQAMMEFGATVCTPKNPSCGKCPLKGHCRAFEMTKTGFVGDIEDCGLCIKKSNFAQELGVANFPRKEKKAKVREATSLTIIIKSREKFLLFQRPKTGLLANLLEFYSLEMDENTPDLKKKFVQEICQSVFRETEADISASRLGEVFHQFSHIKQTYQVWSVELAEEMTPEFEKSKYQKSEWLTKDEIAESGISTAMKKVLQSFTNSDNPKDSSAKKRKREESSTPSKGQKSISSFFKPKAEKK